MGLPPREEGRHPGRTVAGSSSPFLLPFFAKSDAPMQVESHAFEFPPPTWNALFLSFFFSAFLFVLPPIRPLSSTRGFPALPLECNEIWHVPFITPNILLSFGHTFLAARSRVRNPLVLFLFLFPSLVYSSILTKDSICSDSNDNMDPRSAQSGQSVNRYNISLDMQMYHAQLRDSVHSHNRPG